MKQRVLVTGGFGFVGSQLLQLIARRNDLDITVADNLLAGNPLPDVNFVYADVRNANVMDKLIPQYDTIVHLAAVVGEPACAIDPNFSRDVNVSGTINIVAAMRKHQRLIFTSTSSVYGNRPNELVTEESAPLPLNHYARQKYTAELAITESDIEHVIVRPVTAFGITQRTRLDLLVNNLIYDALSYKRIEIYEPNIMRPIIHVLDFARILVEAIDGRLQANNTYNIGDPQYTTTKWKLAQYIAKLCGAKVDIGQGSSLDLRDYDVSFKKLMDTGFIFGQNRLELAIQQIKSIQYEVAEKKEEYTTPYKVMLFLERDSKGV